MTRIDKILAKFLNRNCTFTYKELVVLLESFGFFEENKGKTSGSRVKFCNSSGDAIIMHKPHPSGDLKAYQVKQIKEFLNERGLI